MPFDTLFGLLACSEVLHETSHEASHLRDILSEVTQRGYAVTETATVADAVEAVRSDSAIGCVLLEWGDGDWRHDTDALIETIRARGLECRFFCWSGGTGWMKSRLRYSARSPAICFWPRTVPDFIS
jgi:Orn/Lys/Arg decarboxylase, N-terminal domain.